jgi:hypothetical protein
MKGGVGVSSQYQVVCGGQSYSYSATELRNWLLFVVTSNIFIRF